MSDFPKDFFWGAATSSHQVEGGNILNDWWEWETLGRTKEPSGKTCEHYLKFKEDFKLAKGLNHNCHRFSLEWSRIEPQQGRFSEEALSHYREVIVLLKSLNIEPIVTINHFTLPLWFCKKGGWEQSDSPEIFSVFVERVAKEYGDLVNYWLTLNEPMVYAYQSYFIGKWPPGKSNFSLFLKVVKNLIFAHVLSYQKIRLLIREKYSKDVRVGFSNHTLVFSPCHKGSLKDRISASLRHNMSNHFFVKAIMDGRVFLPGIFNERLPIKKAIDFIGINYYSRDFVRNAGFTIPKVLGEVCTLLHHRDAGRRSFIEWEIYPEGIYRILKEFSRYKLPLIITENGICTEDDNERTEFIIGHLREVKQAIGENIPVFGYIYWSLLDNFEWDKGFSPRFGLIEVDYKTQSRKIRNSALEYAKICKTGNL
ncbi:MAG: glycoside hydrolase family 1 protein [Candidatus Omnitrophica bacterium]|nr:glycoside hydrolase family 1 protein [Candidatus Omnitrophota bacterium]